MKINDKVLDNLLKLSRLEMGKKESAKFISQLGNIFDYVEKIQNYEISEDLISDNNLELKIRKDVAIESNKEYLTSQFSDNENNLLKVKKVL